VICPINSSFILKTAIQPQRTQKKTNHQETTETLFEPPSTPRETKWQLNSQGQGETQRNTFEAIDDRRGPVRSRSCPGSLGVLGGSIEFELIACLSRRLGGSIIVFLSSVNSVFSMAHAFSRLIQCRARQTILSLPAYPDSR
jgi:hypothetical protein